MGEHELIVNMDDGEREVIEDVGEGERVASVTQAFLPPLGDRWNIIKAVIGERQ